jgi:hypothetical protein
MKPPPSISFFLPASNLVQNPLSQPKFLPLLIPVTKGCLIVSVDMPFPYVVANLASHSQTP